MATIKNRQKSSAQWLRCEIIDFLPNANVALRYVDLGTRGILKLKNLHRMHIEHTKIAPACIEIGRFLDDDLSMADSEMEWNTHFWREIVPYDVPIVVGPDMEFLETGKLQFSQIRVAGDEDDENLLDKIPSPSPFFTERSDDLRTQKEDDDDGNVSDDKDSG
ncbi:Protein kinase domain-containing protein [Caenorhabditis elegans]|nr:Protein kinase domain-containing protein [Caenorhabditis elegans]CDH93322.1 Protein kinase domain-containing protein [Caenorhabditis elegans]|eukprot:NP_001294525.1 Enhanced RNAI (RNA interference) [Caenorhabditis elegans]